MKNKEKSLLELFEQAFFFAVDVETEAVEANHDITE